MNGHLASPSVSQTQKSFRKSVENQKKSFSDSIQPFQFNYIKPDAVLEFEPFVSMKISSFRYRKSRISKEISRDLQ